MKLLLFFRALFVVVVMAVIFTYVSSMEVASSENRSNFYIIIFSGVTVIIAAMMIDLLTPKKSLASLAGVFLGLIVGILISWIISPIIDMVNTSNAYLGLDSTVIQAIKLMMGISICFVVINIVIRTKDDVRFIIPYVEFAKQTKGARPLVMDTSAIIDGRIADLYRSKLFDAPMIVPRFVINELQLISDSSDKLKRNRGRRGLDILKQLQDNPGVDLEIDDTPMPDAEDIKGVDQKLVVFTKNKNGRLATTDYNLTKVARVREIDVLNINDLANSLKAIILPGEGMHICIIKAGEEADQGIGYRYGL